MTQIETEVQYRCAMQRIEELLRVVKEDTPEDDINSVELVLLSNLVADYEDIHYPISKPTLVEVLKLRMFELGLSQRDLAAKLEISPSKISEPTLKQAKKMVDVLNISPNIILG